MVTHLHVAMAGSDVTTRVGMPDNEVIEGAVFAELLLEKVDQLLEAELITRVGVFRDIGEFPDRFPRKGPARLHR